MSNPYETALREGLAVRQQTIARLLPVIAASASALVAALETGHKVLVFGNGGSAAEAQHLSGELVGRYRDERAPLPAIALSSDSSIITCTGNDYGYERVFERGVMALGQRGDVAIGLTTSGKSRNVLAGLRAAQACGLVTMALTGDAGLVGTPVDYVLAVPSKVIARIQEEHLAIIHLWCDAIDAAFAQPEHTGLPATSAAP